jgi:hypothetical protein
MVRIVLVASLLLPALASAQTYPLTSLDGIQLHKVKAEPLPFKGRKAVRVTDAGDSNEERIAILTRAEFQDGTIEVDLAGEPGPGASQQARGFVGIAFRVSPDASRFECFYLRPTNGRADDQVRRNHSAQYFSFPEFPWFRLRKESPEKYETYVDLVPAEWTKVKIEARGDKARLWVNAAEQPTLIVNDLKLGASRGAIALFIGPGTIAHFSNLRLRQ